MKTPVIKSKHVMVQAPGLPAIGPFKVHAVLSDGYAEGYARLHFAKQGYFPRSIKYARGIYYILCDFNIPIGIGEYTDCIIPAHLIKQYCEPATESYNQIINKCGIKP